ncbi:hypothetical protein BRD56_00160 [Thermoplasmatales archaeon SW_10_69_26]|nr:MAG: hypothetical protein BRD56_00160 [Thermoplasmatales archaeon SW_10_69_26]
MLGWIILAFVVMPFVELWLLIQIGERIGFWPTLWIVLGTGVLGGVLARYQGSRAWREIFEAMREGRAPKRELVAGALFLFGAALLLTPGVITDAFGFAMMVPPLRRGLAGYLISRVRDSDRIQTYTNTGERFGGFAGSGGGRAEQGYDVDVEGYAKDEDRDDDEGPPRIP